MYVNIAYISRKNALTQYIFINKIINQKQQQKGRDKLKKENTFNRMMDPVKTGEQGAINQGKKIISKEERELVKQLITQKKYLYKKGRCKFKIEKIEKKFQETFPEASK